MTTNRVKITAEIQDEINHLFKVDNRDLVSALRAATNKIHEYWPITIRQQIQEIRIRMVDFMVAQWPTYFNLGTSTRMAG